MKYVRLSTILISVIFAGGAYAANPHQLSDTNSELSYAEARAQMSRLKNIGAQQTSSTIAAKDYSIDEDETIATRQNEAVRTESLANIEYNQPPAHIERTAVPDDDPKGVVWAHHKHGHHH